MIFLCLCNFTNLGAQTLGHDTLRVQQLNTSADVALQKKDKLALHYSLNAFKLASRIKYFRGEARALAHMGTHYLYANNLDSANTYFSQAIGIAEQYSYLSLLAELLKKKGVLQYYAGNTDSALYYFKNSLQLNEQIGDSLEIIKLYNNVGAISLKTRKLDQALNYFYKCLAFDEKGGDAYAIASDYNNISLVFIDKKDLKSAEKYLQKTIEMRKKLQDTIGLVRATINLGIVYTETNRNDALVKLLNPLKQLITEENYPDELSQINNNLGVAYKKKGNYELALSHSNRALEIRKKYEITKDMPALLSNLGSIYLQLKDYPKAIYFAKQGSELAKNAQQIDVEKNAVTILLEASLYTKQNKEALNYFYKLTELNEAFYNVQTAQQVAALQTQFETEKKENENKLLQQDNSIKELELLNQKAKISNQNFAIAALVASLLLLLILVLWRINVHALKKKEQALLAAQKVQQEKERISRDLHDHVGGQLSFVLYTLEDMLSEDAAKREAVSNSIQESVKQVIGNLRETIWAINDEEIRVQDFADKLKMYARNMFRYTKVELTFEEALSQNLAMPAWQGLNLYRICQEILNNSFKYAQAKNLKICISAITHVTVEISDDGIGFDKDTIAEGYGLANIQKRAQETNISVSVQAEPMCGVAYTLVV